MKMLLPQSSISGHTDSGKIFVVNIMIAFKQVVNESKNVSSLRYTTWGGEENEKVDEGANSVLSKEKIDTEIPLSFQ